MHEELQGEIFLYHLLGRVFQSEPTKEMIDGLKALRLPLDEEPHAHGLLLMVSAAQQNYSRSAEWLEELAGEFVRVFIGPLKPLVVPYASFYLSDSRQLMTDETIEVRRRYLEAGMAIKDLYKVPDDHIGIELEFLYYLASESASLMREGRQAEATTFQTMKTDFITSHMALWVPQFAEQLVNVTKEDFFKGAGLLLNALFQE